MTPWIKLNILSFLISAVPIWFVYKHVSRPSHSNGEPRHPSFIETEAFFYGSLFFVTALYIFSISQAVTYDEYSYATALRVQGVFCGPNHFLSHYLGFLAYSLVRFWTNQSLVVLQVLNIITTLLTLVLVRRLVFAVTNDKGLSNLGSLLLGVSYGVWKYAVSGEVYPLMLLFWVAAVYQAVRIFYGRDSWAQFFFLSVLSNLAVLAHDMGSLMAVGFLLSFLIFGGSKRGTYVLRYVSTGILLLPIFQIFAATVCDLETFRGYIDKHLYYYFHPDSEPGDYDFTVTKNMVLIVREGLYSMFVGIDGAWKEYGKTSQALTVLAHGGFTVCLIVCYLVAFGKLKSGLAQNKKILFPLVLVLFNWLTIYSFAIFWRPNDEVHYWFLPFTTLALCFAMSADGKQLSKSLRLNFCWLIAFVFLGSSGLYNLRNERKNLTKERRFEWLTLIPDTSDVVFSLHQTTQIQMAYFKPQAVISGDVNVLDAAVRESKTVLIDVDHPEVLAYFSKSPFKAEPWEPNPFYYRVTLQ